MGGNEPGLTNTGDESRNQAFARDVDNIVEARDVAGGITIHNYGGHVPEQRSWTPIPRETPPPPADFVNREIMLRRLAELVADREAPPRIVVLAGPPGIGKSALARRIAWDMRDRFSGGDLYVDIADFTARVPSRTSAADYKTTIEGHTDMAGVLACCLNGLKINDEHMPAGEAARANLLRNRTALEPVLLVVENATQPAQLRGLSPAARGSLVLATTQRDLTELEVTGEGLVVQLGALDEDDSLELFARRCARHDVQHRELAEVLRRCRGQPIAISALAWRAARLSKGDVAELEAELAAAAASSVLGWKELRIVSDALTVAYDQLPDDARLTYRRLGLVPGQEFAVDTAAAAAEIDQGRARAAIETLVDANLLEVMSGGRYRFHALVGEHAAQTAAVREPAVRDAVLRRVVTHYLTRAAFADRAIMGERSRGADHDSLLAGLADPFAVSDPDPDTARKKMEANAYTWLTAERANLPVVVRAAVDGGYLTEAWQLAEALTAYYLNRRHLEDWITVTELGVQAARHCDPPARFVEAQLRTKVSRAYIDLGEFDEADANLDVAMRIAEELDDVVLRASAWEFRGRYLDAVGRPAEAVEAYERSHALNLEGDEPRGAALASLFQGRSLDALGRHEEALRTLESALRELRAVSDTRMSGRTLIAIGRARCGLGDDARAAAPLEEAVAELAGTYYEAEARELLAGIAERAGDRDVAQRHLRRAFEIYRDAGHPRADDIAKRLDSGQ